MDTFSVSLFERQERRAQLKKKKRFSCVETGFTNVLKHVYPRGKPSVVKGKLERYINQNLNQSKFELILLLKAIFR